MLNWLANFLNLGTVAITRRGGTYLFTSTAVPFDTLVLNYLRERGLLG